MELVSDIYSATRRWPKEEMFGLTSQVRRSAVSIPSNIAEGYGREHRGTYLQFLRIADRVGVAESGSVTPLLERLESVGKLLRLLLRKLAAT